MTCCCTANASSHDRPKRIRDTRADVRSRTVGVTENQPVHSAKRTIVRQMLGNRVPLPYVLLALHQAMVAVHCRSEHTSPRTDFPVTSSPRSLKTRAGT